MQVGSFDAGYGSSIMSRLVSFVHDSVLYKLDNCITFSSIMLKIQQCDP